MAAWSIWMRICRKQATCGYCKKPILNKELMVVGLRRKGKWRFRKCWHPECWLEQGKQELERREYVETRGCKRMPIDDETRKRRFRLLARRASVLQRIRKAVEVRDANKVVHLGEMLDRIKEEIGPLGGVPKSW